MKKKTRRSMLKREQRAMKTAASANSMMHQRRVVSMSSSSSFLHDPMVGISQHNHTFDSMLPVNNSNNLTLATKQNIWNIEDERTQVKDGKFFNQENLSHSVDMSMYRPQMKFEGKQKYCDKRYSITTSFVPIDDYSETLSNNVDDQYSRMAAMMSSSESRNLLSSICHHCDNNNNIMLSHNYDDFLDQSSRRGTTHNELYSRNYDEEFESLRKKLLEDESFPQTDRNSENCVTKRDDTFEHIQHTRQPRRQSIVVSPTFDMV
jgi:hypothetical protein